MKEFECGMKRRQKLSLHCQVKMASTFHDLHDRRVDDKFIIKVPIKYQSELMPSGFSCGLNTAHKW